VRGVTAATFALLIVCSAGCLTFSEQSSPTKPAAKAARLVLALPQSDQQPTQLHAVDPDTLADIPMLDPLEQPPCSSSLAAQPGGNLAAVMTGQYRRQCADSQSATLRVLDLSAWAWRPEIALPTPPDQPLSPLATLAWSADGQSVYALTSTPSEQRQLWLLDASGKAQPVSTSIDFVPTRLDVAPNGSAIFVLGGQTAGNSRRGAAVTGSAFVAIYDPKTLAERIRVPLSGLSLGRPGSPSGTLSPGVAIAPDGSRYFVAHADRPVLDVVDTRAPRLERLERSLSLRDAASQYATRQAWLGVSPDGSHLFTWRRADTPGDDLGLQIVDVRTWQVQTVDSVAERMGVSLDGRWLFQLDPPAWARPGASPPQQRGPRDPAGSRLSVLDGTTRSEVAVLLQNEIPYGVGQYGPDRAYVGSASPAQRQVTLVAYDTTSWQEIARRALDAPGALVTVSPLW
jgi:hypothetical protein